MVKNMLEDAIVDVGEAPTPEIVRHPACVGFLSYSERLRKL